MKNIDTAVNTISNVMTIKAKCFLYIWIYGCLIAFILSVYLKIKLTFSSEQPIIIYAKNAYFGSLMKYSIDLTYL